MYYYYYIYICVCDFVGWWGAGGHSQDHQVLSLYCLPEFWNAPT